MMLLCFIYTDAFGDRLARMDSQRNPPRGLRALQSLAAFNNTKHNNNNISRFDKANKQ